MKVRKGFVSNSSSSSFVCDLTGEAFEIYDGDWDNSFLEYELAQCVDGHVFQCSDFPKVMEFIEDGNSPSEVPVDICPLCTKDPIAVEAVKERIYDIMRLVDLKPSDLQEGQ